MGINQYTAHLEPTSKGSIVYWGVYLPDLLVRELGIKANTRLIVKLNNKEYYRAALSNGLGQFYIAVSQPMRRELKISTSDEVQVYVRLDPNPDEVHLPEEMEAALDTDPEALKVFETLTPGLKRSVMHYVNSAKRTDTRIKRALELCEKLRNHTLHGMKKEKS